MAVCRDPSCPSGPVHALSLRHGLVLCFLQYTVTEPTSPSRPRQCDLVCHLQIETSLQPPVKPAATVSTHKKVPRQAVWGSGRCGGFAGIAHLCASVSPPVNSLKPTQVPPAALREGTQPHTPALWSCLQVSRTQSIVSPTPGPPTYPPFNQSRLLPEALFGS